MMRRIVLTRGSDVKFVVTAMRARPGKFPHTIYMSSPQITLQTVTGVDVELTIAGPGSRSYAFVIDWHIRLLVALAWVFVAQLVYTGGTLTVASGVGRSYLLGVWVPALTIYFLYHPALEIAMRGRTPGKRMAGVRLVTREGDIPGFGALLLRNIFRLLDSLPFLYLVGLATVVMTEHHVRVGDLAAGTLLVMDHDSSASSFASGAHAKDGLTPQAADLIQELLDRWPALEEEKRATIARSLLARVEPQLSGEELAALGSLDLRNRLVTKLGVHPAGFSGAATPPLGHE